MANDQPPRKPRPPLASTTSATSPSSRCSTETDSICTGGKRTPHNPKTPDAKHSNRVLKRPSAARAAADPRASETRYKRVWKACERCRMKKTKCDGENPCKRCKDDGVICTAGTRKKTEYKQVPNGYVELLENGVYKMQRSMIKLYAMVRAREEWTFEEPSLNKEGLPAIHDIARALGVGGHSDTDLDMFPENEEESNKLIEKLRAEEANGHNLKRESSDDTPYMVRQHSKPHSDADSDTSFSTEDRPSTLSSSNAPLRLAPKALAPLQLDQMQYLPCDMTSASQFDAEFFDTLSQTSPLYSDFTQESPDDDIMWMGNAGAGSGTGLSMGLPPNQGSTAPLHQQLEEMSTLGRVNGFDAPTRDLNTQAYVYGIGAPQSMGGMAGTGTIRPGMLDKMAPLTYEACARANTACAVDSNPWSFKNFQPPQ